MSLVVTVLGGRTAQGCRVLRRLTTKPRLVFSWWVVKVTEGEELLQSLQVPLLPLAFHPEENVHDSRGVGEDAPVRGAARLGKLDEKVDRVVRPAGVVRAWLRG